MTLSVAAAESGGNWNLWQKWAINIVGKTRRRRRHVCAIFQACCANFFMYSNFRKYAHPLHVKEGIITEKVFPVFSEIFLGACFGVVM